ncbi:MAG: hypothetical protein WCC12_06295, partial [Anaerolineales bacterium]
CPPSIFCRLAEKKEAVPTASFFILLQLANHPVDRMSQNLRFAFHTLLLGKRSLILMKRDFPSTREIPYFEVGISHANDSLQPGEES